jgi:hypothetical protein
MARGLRLDAIEDEGELDVHRVLAPQRSVVIEGGDTLIHGHEVRSALRCNARDKIGDRSLRRAVVPGRQWIGLGLHLCGCGAERTDQSGEHGQAREQKPPAELIEGRGERIHCRSSIQKLGL